LLDDFGGSEDGAGDEFGEGGGGGVDEREGEYAIGVRGGSVEAGEERFCAFVGREESSC
jgi:hypothetical protein